MAPIWTIGGASVRGASHLRSGKPNQDALAWHPPAGVAARVVGAVSDGHGARAHFRSADGARIAVEQAIARLTRLIAEPESDEANAALAGDILRAWRRAVDADAAGRPYSAEEAALLTGPRLGAYGATLLTLAAEEDALTILQIGDGDLMLGYPDGRIERALRSDAGLVGEETYSLCQEDAETRFRVTSLWRTDEAHWPDFALLATDGVSKSYRDDAAFEGAVARLRDLARSDWVELMSSLPAWLEELSGKGSGDDATLCLAIRTQPKTT
ncbi:MAG: protein phosphatase 2C domain-containing protein [Caulobacteraceae bacterium]|nr:MAG: protein phosphatase 2C domain-containing protein [Caulobacteraceae bacterium]